MDENTIRRMVKDTVAEVKVTDLHTHLYSPEFGPLMLWGIDETLTYHYLIAEALRRTDMPYDDFWALSKQQQADLIWRVLFIEHSPVSEACRGVLTVLKGFGLDASVRDLDAHREFFHAQEQDLDRYVETLFDAAGVESVVMTNDPFDDTERPLWLGVRPEINRRFKAALRVDVMLNLWDTAWPKLAEWGYDVREDLSGNTFSEVRRFLAEWIDRMDALYMAVSLPPDFDYPCGDIRGRLIDECIIPVARAKGIPFALMIGVRRQINPGLRLAGDGLGVGRVEAVERLCDANQDTKFMVTMLARENQHALCVAARKLRNLMVFGCWWFLNNPSLIEEMTRMRLELLGLSVIPQHSDARILEQLLYKWTHSRQVIGDVLADKYSDLAATGWAVTEEEIRRDVADLFGGNFWEFIGRPAPADA